MEIKKTIEILCSEYSRLAINQPGSLNGFVITLFSVMMELLKEYVVYLLLLVNFTTKHFECLKDLLEKQMSLTCGRLLFTAFYKLAAFGCSPSEQQTQINPSLPFLLTYDVIKIHL